jgi:hypothetical protein
MRSLASSPSIPGRFLRVTILMAATTLIAATTLVSSVPRADEPLGRELLILRVDPRSGIDDRTRFETGEPLRSVRFALDALPEDVTSVEIELAPGEYSVGSSETFPWSIPARVRRLVVRGPAPGGAPAIVDATSPRGATSLGGTVLEIGPSTAGIEGDPPRTVEFRELVFRGGRHALAAELPPRRELRVFVDRCRLERVERAALDLIVGDSARALLEVSASTFDDCGAGVSLEVAERGSARLGIEAGEFRREGGFGPFAFAGGAVEIHAGGESSVEAIVRRSRFEDTGNAFVITTAGTGARIDLIVASSLLLTSAERACGDLSARPTCELLHAVYLSAADPGSVVLRFLGNTIFGVSRAFLASEESVARAPGTVRLDLLSNIFVGDTERPAGGFAAAVLGTSQAASIAVPDLVTAQSNILPRDWVEVLDGLLEGGVESGGQIPVDGADQVGFVDPASDDLRLRADSLALDAGRVDEQLLLLAGALDFAGNCRVSGPEHGAPSDSWLVDIGAHELELGRRCRYEKFLRGDCNGTTSVDVSDAITTFQFLFLGRRRPECLDACDATDEGRIDITDGIRTLAFLFLGGAPLPSPFGEPGHDPTPDTIGPCRLELPE